MEIEYIINKIMNGEDLTSNGYIFEVISHSNYSIDDIVGFFNSAHNELKNLMIAEINSASLNDELYVTRVNAICSGINSLNPVLNEIIMRHGIDW